MARLKTAADSTKILSRRVLVVITRDAMTKTPRVIWQHEKPILEAIFAEGNVVEVDPSTMDEGYQAKAAPELLIHNKKQDQIPKPSDSASLGFVFVGNPQSEYSRLEAAYGRHPEINVSMVEHVYGRFQEGRFTSVVSGADVEDMPDGQIRELAKSYGYLPEVSKDSTDAEKVDARAKQLELATMPRDKLLKLTEDLGVTLD